MKGEEIQQGGPESLSPTNETAMEHPTKERHKAPDYEEHKKSQKTLKNMGDLKRAVKCPDKDHLDEWLAVHTVDFYSHITILYGSISEFCTPRTCRCMCAGPKFEYLWAEGESKPVQLSAPAYIEKLFNWIQAIIDNEIFPVQADAPFSPNFRATIKQVLKRLFRVYAHMYYHHFDKIQGLGEEAHINTCLQHLSYFVNEFKLVDKKDMTPLEELISQLCRD